MQNQILPSTTSNPTSAIASSTNTFAVVAALSLAFPQSDQDRNWIPCSQSASRLSTIRDQYGGAPLNLPSTPTLPLHPQAVLSRPPLHTTYNSTNTTMASKCTLFTGPMFLAAESRNHFSPPPGTKRWAARTACPHQMTSCLGDQPRMDVASVAFGVR